LFFGLFYSTVLTSKVMYC